MTKLSAQQERDEAVRRLRTTFWQIRQGLAPRQAYLNQAEAAFEPAAGELDWDLNFWQLLAAIEPIPAALLTELNHRLAELHHADGRLAAEKVK